jgi:hypothetical protein
MPIVQRESARNLTELAQRLYGLGPQNRRLTAAVRALTAANPTLPADLSALPPAAPIVAPSAAGLSPKGTSAMPQDVDLLNLVRSVAKAGGEIVTAAQSGSPPAQDPARAEMLQRFVAAQSGLKLPASVPQQAAPQRLATQLQMLNDSIAAFLKRHGG